MHQVKIKGSFSDSFGKKRPDPPLPPPPPPSPKRQTIEPTVNQALSQVRKATSEVVAPVQKTNVYDSVAAKLIRIINQWILRLNDRTIQTIQSNMKISKNMIHCIVGPSGSGKSWIAQSLLKQQQIQFSVYDDFADVGQRTDKEDQESCAGCLSPLMLDTRPTAIIMDGIDRPGETWFIRSLKKQYEQFLPYRQPNKWIFILVASLKDFTLRQWIRDVGAHIYYLRDRLFANEQSQLLQLIQREIPMRRDDPIRQFNGDFRRMGIDLTTCAHETAEYKSNTNQVVKVASLFDMSRHLLSWPAEPLSHPLVYCEEPNQLMNMISGNHTNRVSNSASETSEVFDELMRTTEEISGVSMVQHCEMEDGSSSDIRVSPGIPPITSTARLDSLLMFGSLYASNQRLKRTLRPVRKDTYSLQFVRGVQPKRHLNQQTQYNYLCARGYCPEYQSTKQISKTRPDLDSPFVEFPPKEKT